MTQGARQVTAEKMCKVIEAARRLGALSPELAAAVLRIPISEARLLVAALEAAGWIERINSQGSSCPCSRCPFARFCPFARRGQVRPMYRVSPRALERCRRLREKKVEKPVEENTQSNN